MKLTYNFDKEIQTKVYDIIIFLLHEFANFYYYDEWWCWRILELCFSKTMNVPQRG